MAGAGRGAFARPTNVALYFPQRTGERSHERLIDRRIRNARSAAVTDTAMDRPARLRSLRRVLPRPHRPPRVSGARERDRRRARDGAGADAALCGRADHLVHRSAHQGDLCDLPVAGRHVGHDARLSGRAGGQGPHPAVLVVHENRGLNPYIEDVARRAAAEGFLALAPDGLFPVGGYPGNDDDGRTLQAKLDQGKLRTDMLNSARFVKAHAGSSGKLGVTGFCWGGSTVNFLAATLGPDMQAGAPYYGAAADTASAANIK